MRSRKLPERIEDYKKIYKKNRLQSKVNFVNSFTENPRKP
uniref:Uncharacterized protein n=1 Tax=Anguilla anguilla TaxID=7936 RepID=A0A0E9QEP1_ANGAN